jgi:2,3-bisphosphoglycerate-independent phosphoglycerate mutase
MAIIFIFVDGVGLGERSDLNPFTNGETYSSFSFMTEQQPFTIKVENIQKEGHVFKSIDARLGIDGLPQSGTGQTTLFTGKNASKIAGRHFGPFPHSKTKYLYRENSIFIRLQEKGKSCYFMNAFPQIFFDKAKERDRWSCCTYMTRSAGIPLNSVNEVLEGKAITAGILQDGWRKKLNIDVPSITAEEAAGRVVDMADEKDFILIEYYLTDKAGHSQDLSYSHKILHRLDQFLYILIHKKRKKDTLFLTSDHGNIEDLSTRTHTFNKVPMFVYGPGAQQFTDVESIKGITDVTVRSLTL